MLNRLALLALLLSPISGCKDKAPEEVAPEPVAVATSPEPPAVTPVVPIEPEPEVPSKVSEHPMTIFEAASQKVVAVQWQISEEVISFRADAKRLEGEVMRYDVHLMAQVAGGDETTLFSCKALKATSLGRMDLILRGDKLHVLCITPVQAEERGTTDAARFAFDLGQRALLASGTYGGEGDLDLDTIDLDEGE